MTETGAPKDNPQAERINNTINNELLLGMKFHSLYEVWLSRQLWSFIIMRDHT